MPSLNLTVPADLREDIVNEARTRGLSVAQVARERLQGQRYDFRGSLAEQEDRVAVLVEQVAEIHRRLAAIEDLAARAA